MYCITDVFAPLRPRTDTRRTFTYASLETLRSAIISCATEGNLTPTALLSLAQICLFSTEHQHHRKLTRACGSHFPKSSNLNSRGRVTIAEVGTLCRQTTLPKYERPSFKHDTNTMATLKIELVSQQLPSEVFAESGRTTLGDVVMPKVCKESMFARSG